MEREGMREEGLREEGVGLGRGGCRLGRGLPILADSPKRDAAEPAEAGNAESADSVGACWALVSRNES